MARVSPSTEINEIGIEQERQVLTSNNPGTSSKLLPEGMYEINEEMSDKLEKGKKYLFIISPMPKGILVKE